MSDNIDLSQLGRFESREQVPQYFRVTCNQVIHGEWEFQSGKQYQSRNFPLGVLSALLRAQVYDAFDERFKNAIEFYNESKAAK